MLQNLARVTLAQISSEQASDVPKRKHKGLEAISETRDVSKRVEVRMVAISS